MAPLKCNPWKLAGVEEHMTFHPSARSRFTRRASKRCPKETCKSRVDASRDEMCVLGDQILELYIPMKKIYYIEVEAKLIIP